MRNNFSLKDLYKIIYTSLLIFLGAFIVSVSCTRPAEQISNAHTSGRIKIKYQLHAEGHTYQIVEVDSVEFLVVNSSGIAKIN